MAINLSNLSKPTGQRPIIVTLFGEGGMGKTTLAAMFPKPVFIRTEDGTASITGHDDALLFDMAKSTKTVFEQIEALATQEHDRKTLVIDSISQFEKIAINEIIDSEQNPKCKSMPAALGGYGKAYGVLDKTHQDLREAAGYLAHDCGMNVVFLLHASVEDMDLPDSDKYSRYTVNLHKNKNFDCTHHYINNVDLVALVRLKTFTRGDGDKKRAISNGEREIICFPQAASVTKNRFNLDKPLTFTFDGGNPFENFVAK
jgi:hypothetical protein